MSDVIDETPAAPAPKKYIAQFDLADHASDWSCKAGEALPEKAVTALTEREARQAEKVTGTKLDHWISIGWIKEA